MKLRKYAIQIFVAMVLYIIVSLILEKDYSRDILIREAGEGFIFGILYGLYLFLRNRFRKKEEN
ncbi:hypothetical protein ACA086_09210 [Muriicola sp. E247]|uniref:hypothetical protein n=1 Tax=Muriicola sp. E247 TaxID=3242730 RepID=UPI0035231824